MSCDAKPPEASVATLALLGGCDVLQSNVLRIIERKSRRRKPNAIRNAKMKKQIQPSQPKTALPKWSVHKTIAEKQIFF